MRPLAGSHGIVREDRVGSRVDSDDVVLFGAIDKELAFAVDNPGLEPGPDLYRGDRRLRFGNNHGDGTTFTVDDETVPADRIVADAVRHFLRRYLIDDC